MDENSKGQTGNPLQQTTQSPIRDVEHAALSTQSERPGKVVAFHDAMMQMAPAISPPDQMNKRLPLIVCRRAAVRPHSGRSWK